MDDDPLHSRPTRIGIFGGSFNPVHKGHTALAQYICDEGLADEVWFMVSPHNPLKEETELADENLRLEMVRLAVQDHPQLRASDFEFHLPHPSYTYITLQKLKDAFPDKAFSLIIGSDNWNLFPRWRNSDFILQHYPIIVYPRQGETNLPHERQEAVSSANFKKPIFLQDAPLFPISSTEIRQAIRRKEDVSEWVDKVVIELIRKKRLYRK